MRKRPFSKRATLDDVARAAGVSRATVSRVVNGTSTVGTEAVKAVRQALDELRYTPNLVARSLMTRRTDLVALVAGEPDVRVFTDPFFAGIIHGVSSELAEVDIRLILAMIHRQSDSDSIAQYLLAGHADGVLVISEHASHNLVGQLQRADVPVVVGGRPAGGAAGVAFVDNDNVQGGRLAGRRLVERGCRRIATVAGPRDMTAGIDRLAGFREALGDRFAPERVVHGDFTLPGGIVATEQLLAADPDIDGVFAASDLMGLGVLETLQRRGRRVPDDVAVVGFDDIDLARATTPPLTTVRQDPVTQGQAMVRLLLEILGRSGDLPRATRFSMTGRTSVVLPVELVVRASA